MNTASSLPFPLAPYPHKCFTVFPFRKKLFPFKFIFGLTQKVVLTASLLSVLGTNL